MLHSQHFERQIIHHEHKQNGIQSGTFLNIVSRIHDPRETILKSLSGCHCCFGWGAGAGGAGLKHWSKNAVYKTNAIDKAINAYMNILSSGCLNLFFRSHSRTSSSFMRSPVTNMNDWQLCTLFLNLQFF